MENNDRTIRVLGILTAVTPLCICGLCLWELAKNGSGILPIGGAMLSLVGASLVAGLLTVFQRRMLVEQERQRSAMEVREEIYKQEMEQLRISTKQEMDAFRSSLAHSLRMPVAIIQGYAELLAGNMITSPEVREEYLEKIVQRSQYMSDVMTRHFSAEETIDDSKVAYEELEILELVRKVASDFQMAAEEKGITIQVVSPEDRLTMTADAYLLNRAFFNLIENALKYMRRPGVVTIRVLRKGEQVSLLVQDDGLGLPTEETAHIFEPRFQGKNHVSGSGYGLYLVKQAIEAHRGTVSAQSAPGRGMGITMVLPLHPEKESASA